ncbi:mCG1028065, isoform CRA_b, partial [Mus musculus]
ASGHMALRADPGWLQTSAMVSCRPEGAQAWLKAPFTRTGTVFRWDALVCGLSSGLLLRLRSPEPCSTDLRLGFFSLL